MGVASHKYVVPGGYRLGVLDNPQEWTKVHDIKLAVEKVLHVLRDAA